MPALIIQLRRTVLDSRNSLERTETSKRITTVSRNTMRTEELSSVVVEFFYVSQKFVCVFHFFRHHPLCEIITNMSLTEDIIEKLQSVYLCLYIEPICVVGQKQTIEHLSSFAFTAQNPLHDFFQFFAAHVHILHMPENDCSFAQQL